MTGVADLSLVVQALTATLNSWRPTVEKKKRSLPPCPEVSRNGIGL
ncbi:MAG TPA: hypothetical protein VLT32_11585 [Candidatus Sulfomarinibacteraceae bacterium]|nr:hypothetical protein [Candidatus Sulfomarinibacteraceae bacterium]